MSFDNLPKRTEDIYEMLVEALERIKNLESTQGESPILTRQQTADFFSKGVNTIDNWTKDGTLKAYKVQGTPYYKREELLQVVDNCRIVTLAS